MTQLDTDLTRIVTALAETQATIADLTAHAEELKTELRQLPIGDHDVNGRPAVRIIANRRFDAAGAASMLDPDIRQTCLTVTFDAAKVKSHLSPVQVDAHMVEVGKNKVVLL